MRQKTGQRELGNASATRYVVRCAPGRGYPHDQRQTLLKDRPCSRMDCRWEGCSEWSLGVDPWWVTSLTADAVGFIHAALTIPVALVN